MQHGFSHTDWLAYLDGGLTEPVLSRLIAHVAGCAECRDFLWRTRIWETCIANEARSIAGAAAVSQETVDGMVRAALQRINEAAPAGSGEREASLAAATALLGRVLEPLVGSWTARQAISEAARRSSGVDASEMQVQHWESFIRNLRATAGSLCGANTERLIDLIGELALTEIR